MVSERIRRLRKGIEKRKESARQRKERARKAVNQSRAVRGGRAAASEARATNREARKLAGELGFTSARAREFVAGSGGSRESEEQGGFGLGMAGRLDDSRELDPFDDGDPLLGGRSDDESSFDVSEPVMDFGFGSTAGGSEEAGEAFDVSEPVVDFGFGSTKKSGESKGHLDPLNDDLGVGDLEDFEKDLWG